MATNSGEHHEKEVDNRSSNNKYREVEIVSHSTKFTDAFTKFKTLNLFCDTVLVAGTTRIPVHKNVLAAVSPFLMTLFTSKPTPGNEIPMDDMEGDSLEAIVNYIYTGSIRMTSDNIHELLSIADRLQLEEVGNACCEYLGKGITSKNCFDFLKISQRKAYRGLVTVCQTFLEKNLRATILDNNDYVPLLMTQLLQLISSDELHESEFKIFELARTWIENQSTITEAERKVIWECIRFELMSRHEIDTILADEHFVKQNSECCFPLLEAMKFHCSTDASKYPYPKRPRKYSSKNNKILAVFGGDKLVVELYDFNHLTWRPSIKTGTNVNQLEITTPLYVSRMAVTILRKNIYLVGGFDNQSALNTVYAYSLRTRNWKSVASMRWHRQGLKVVVVNDCLYAIGGNSGNSNQSPRKLASVELYNPDAKYWRTVTSMSIHRTEHAAVAMAGKIYALGGLETERSVERYEPQHNVWHSVAAMGIGGEGLAAATLNGRLYVVGGSPDHMKGEMFNAECGSWQRIADMTIKRQYSELIAHNGSLFAVGGTGDDVESELTMDEYDPNTDTWKMMYGRLSNRRSRFGSVLISNSLIQ